MEELKESYQEKLENTFEMYKDAIKEHAYQSAMTSLENDYVPLDELIAEQEKVEVRFWGCFFELAVITDLKFYPEFCTDAVLII